MADDQQERSPEWGMGTGWAVLGTLISGMVVWGGIGALLDWWLGTKFCFPTGLVLGAAGGIYLVVRRFAVLAAGPDEDQTPDPKTQRGNTTDSNTRNIEE